MSDEHENYLPTLTGPGERERARVAEYERRRQLAWLLGWTRGKVALVEALLDDAA